VCYSVDKLQVITEQSNQQDLIGSDLFSIFSIFALQNSSNLPSSDVGATSDSQPVFFPGRAAFYGRVALKSLVTLNGRIFLDGRAYRNGRVSRDGRAYLDGRVSLDGRTYLDGRVSLDGLISLDSRVTFGHCVGFDGRVTCDGWAGLKADSLMLVKPAVEV
jgi:hypothetical protein